MKFLNETGLAHLWANLKTLLQGKQDTLTAGTGIDITNNVISATGGGGASYTAGDGINIDSNNEISNNASIRKYLPVFNSGLVAGYSLGDTAKIASNIQELATYIMKDGIAQYNSSQIYLNANDFNAVYNTNFSFRYFPEPVNNPIGNSESTYYNSTSTSNLPFIARQYFIVVKSSETQIYVFSSLNVWKIWAGYNLGSIIQINRNVSNINNTSNRIDLVFGSLNTFVGDVKEKLPTAPSTDGNYTLNCDISSGTASYSWDTLSGGTTYTAGANISINNGEISATDTTYTAGTNISITNGVISATDTTYTAGTGINISNGEISSTVQGIPTAPANDGTYMLKCVVSSVTPTYSWESITIGGSY